ncbi:DMT family transporter [Litoribrevibacter albus]|uniref:Membrane protein n=1 Tax=Litoribrevibacter albus TaxID=1473156 RepID=A0AA37SFQ3_9GAMM|nr:DMT family transporter [Litoribrevibacter albus]GLQ33334.1 membrane protein [Litoribrevibacter albus]
MPTLSIQPSNSPKLTGYLCAILAVLIWSGFILVSRQGGISDLTPYDVIAIRYTTCSLVLLPLWWKFRFRLWQPKLIVSSLIGALLYALFAFNGFETTPASHTSVLLPGLMPLAISILSIPLLKVAIPKQKWLGLTVITIGVGILLWQAWNTTHSGSALHEGHGLHWGHGLVVLAGLCWALYSVLLSKWQITPWQATVSLAMITFCLYMPVYLIWLPKQISMELVTSMQSHLPLWKDIALQAFYQGVMATIIQMLLYVRAVQTIGAPAMGAMMALVPILAGVASTVIFDEPLTTPLLCAFGLVSFGVWLANQAKPVTPFLLRKHFNRAVSINNTSSNQ